MSAGTPLCPRCHRWHASNNPCPAINPQEKQPRQEHADQKAVDDAEDGEIAEFIAYRKGKQP